MIVWQQQKYRVQIECNDTCNYEHYGRRKSPGLPSEAVYGPSSAFYYLFAAIVFPDPDRAGRSRAGGDVRRQTGRCVPLGRRSDGRPTGFLAIWLQWIESTIWYPTVLTFGAVSIAFIGMDPASRHDAGVEQSFHTDRRTGHLLGRHGHRPERADVGRQDFENRRYDRDDYPSRPADRPRDHLPQYRRT